MTKQFSTIAYRRRVGLTQRQLGQMLDLGTETVGERTVRRWEATERGTSTTRNSPDTQTIMLMMVYEKLWRMFHDTTRKVTRKRIGALLPGFMLTLVP